jgi:hypothetical protein
MRPYLIIVTAYLFYIRVFAFDKTLDCPEKRVLLPGVVYGFDERA